MVHHLLHELSYLPLPIIVEKSLSQKLRRTWKDHYMNFPQTSMSSSTLLSLGYNRLTMLSPWHLPILQSTHPRWLQGSHQPNVTSFLPIRGCTNATWEHNHTRWKHTNHPNPHNPIPHNHKQTPQHITLIKCGSLQNRFQGRFRTWEVRHGSIFVLGSSRSHTQRHLSSNCTTLRSSQRCPNHDNPKTHNPKTHNTEWKRKRGAHNRRVSVMEYTKEPISESSVRREDWVKEVWEGSNAIEKRWRRGARNARGGL